MDSEERNLLIRALIWIPITFLIGRHELRKWRAWKASRFIVPKGARNRERWAEVREAGDRRWRRKAQLLIGGLGAGIIGAVLFLLDPLAPIVPAALLILAGGSLFLYGWMSAPALPDDRE